MDSRNVPGDIRYRRCLEEAAEGDLDVRHFAYARQELGGQEGVSSQLEEVVVDPYTLETEHCRPEPCQHLLERRAWRGVGRVECRPILDQALPGRTVSAKLRRCSLPVGPTGMASTMST